jgi:hypothetical protein
MDFHEIWYGDVYKNLPRNPNLIKIREKYQELYLKMYVHFIIAGDIKAPSLTEDGSRQLASLSLFVCISADPAERVSVKVNVGDFYENLLINSKFG